MLRHHHLLSPELLQKLPDWIPQIFSWPLQSSPHSSHSDPVKMHARACHPTAQNSLMASHITPIKSQTKSYKDLYNLIWLFLWPPLLLSLAQSTPAILLLEISRHSLTSEPLHLLFLLAIRLFPNIFSWHIPHLFQILARYPHKPSLHSLPEFIVLHSICLHPQQVTYFTYLICLLSAFLNQNVRTEKAGGFFWFILFNDVSSNFF